MSSLMQLWSSIQTSFQARVILVCILLILVTLVDAYKRTKLSIGGMLIVLTLLVGFLYSSCLYHGDLDGGTILLIAAPATVFAIYRVGWPKTRRRWARS